MLLILCLLGPDEDAQPGTENAGRLDLGIGRRLVILDGRIRRQIPASCDDYIALSGHRSCCQMDVLPRTQLEPDFRSLSSLRRFHGRHEYGRSSSCWTRGLFPYVSDRSHPQPRTGPPSGQGLDWT